MSVTQRLYMRSRLFIFQPIAAVMQSREAKTDFALVELSRSVNLCSPEEREGGRCWTVTPVRLPDPFIYIKELEIVRTLGNHLHFCLLLILICGLI